jgi:invasion protein IalB
MSLSSKPIPAGWLLALVLALAGAALPRATAAQEEGVFDDWRLICDAIPAGGQQCALVQRVEASDRADVWLSAYVFRPDDGGDQMLLSVLVPLQVVLTKGLGLKVDSGELTTYDYIKCSVEGCLASIALDESLTAALRGGNEALFVFYFEDASGIGMPVSLAGFSAGLDSLQQQ